MTYKMIEKSYIKVPPEKVWPFIAIPENFQKWNDKIVSMEAKDKFYIGQPYVTHYKLTKIATQCMSTVTNMEPERLLEIKHITVASEGAQPTFAGQTEALERITLTPKGSGTVVIKEVWINGAEIPWFLRPIIWFVTTFGRPVDEDKLKKICEDTFPS